MNCTRACRHSRCAWPARDSGAAWGRRRDGLGGNGAGDIGSRSAKDGLTVPAFCPCWMKLARPGRRPNRLRLRGSSVAAPSRNPARNVESKASPASFAQGCHALCELIRLHDRSPEHRYCRNCREAGPRPGAYRGSEGRHPVCGAGWPRYFAGDGAWLCEPGIPGRRFRAGHRPGARATCLAGHLARLAGTERRYLHLPPQPVGTFAAGSGWHRYRRLWASLAGPPAGLSLVQAEMAAAGNGARCAGPAGSGGAAGLLGRCGRRHRQPGAHRNHSAGDLRLCTVELVRRRHHGRAAGHPLVHRHIAAPRSGVAGATQDHGLDRGGPDRPGFRRAVHRDQLGSLRAERRARSPWPHHCP